MDDKEELQEEDSPQTDRPQPAAPGSLASFKGHQRGRATAPALGGPHRPYYERFSGARMYEHTRTQRLRDGLNALAGRPLAEATPTALPAAPAAVGTRPVRRPRPAPRPCSATLGSGSRKSARPHPGGPGVVPPGPAPWRRSRGNGVPMLALPPGPPATPAQKARMSRSDHCQPGKQAMTRAPRGVG